jgi:APA family basic amino acid/polyamine antiporter
MASQLFARKPLSLPAENWWRLFGWLALGFLIYFGHSRRHSVMRHYLAKQASGGDAPKSEGGAG